MLRSVFLDPMNVRIAAVLSSAIALLSGCFQPSANEKFKDEILAADKAFSAASKRDGVEQAFLPVIAMNGKLLNDPRSGADAVRATYMQFPKTAVLTWEPSFVDVAASGDLGYSWGRYTLTLPNVKKGAAPVIQMGTYVTIWRHQPDGSWKVVLDGGNADGEK
jgi:ketosteroid isomerase-like protein